MVPTNKQVRKQYKKCRRYFYLLQCALNNAHNCGLINYDNAGAKLPSVCDAVYDAKKRFEMATEKQLAHTIRQELLNELKGVW